MISKLLSSLYIVPVHTHARVQNTNNLINLGKKKEKRVHIFFSQTRSPGKKRVDVRVSRVACPYHSWNPLLFAWGFVAFTPQTSWKLGAAEHPHRLAHTHTRSLAHSHTHTYCTRTHKIMHFGLESAVAIIPGPVPFGCPQFHKNV